jgi:hypothetical protein
LVTNMVKEEFKDIEFHDGGGLNLMVIRDTQSSRKIDFHGYRGVFFLTFGFKDGMCVACSPEFQSGVRQAEHTERQNVTSNLKGKPRTGLVFGGQVKRVPLWRHGRHS